MSDAKVVLKVWQVGRFRWFAMVRNLAIGAPYISIDAYGLTKDRAVKKAHRRFDRFMHRYVRQETTTEVRSLT